MSTLSIDTCYEQTIMLNCVYVRGSLTDFYNLLCLNYLTLVWYHDEHMWFVVMHYYYFAVLYIYM